MIRHSKPNIDNNKMPVNNFIISSPPPSGTSETGISLPKEFKINGIIKLYWILDLKYFINIFILKLFK